jgi:hypothetical protein
MHGPTWIFWANLTAFSLQPFDPVVRFDDGTVQNYSTFERPHFVFNAEGAPRGETDTYGVQGVHLDRLGLFLHTCTPCVRRAPSACLPS